MVAIKFDSIIFLVYRRPECVNSKNHSWPETPFAYEGSFASIEGYTGVLNC